MSYWKTLAARMRYLMGRTYNTHKNSTDTLARLAAILELYRTVETGLPMFWTVKRIAGELDVADRTVRRNLKQGAKRGLLLMARTPDGGEYEGVNVPAGAYFKEMLVPGFPSWIARQVAGGHLDLHPHCEQTPLTPWLSPPTGHPGCPPNTTLTGSVKCSSNSSREDSSHKDDLPSGRKPVKDGRNSRLVDSQKAVPKTPLSGKRSRRPPSRRRSEHRCKECGVGIPRGYDYCPACSLEQDRKADEREYWKRLRR